MCTGPASRVRRVWQWYERWRWVVPWCQIISLVLDSYQAGYNLVSVSQLTDLRLHDLALLCLIEILDVLKEGILENKCSLFIVVLNSRCLGRPEATHKCIPSLSHLGASSCFAVRPSIPSLLTVCSALDATTH